MFNHVMVGTDDMEAARKFYTSSLAALGHDDPVEDAKGRLFWLNREGTFGVTLPIDGKPATHANGGTIGFSASSEAEVDAWFEAGKANGGTVCEDPPGIRQGVKLALYIAYLRDPSGNKLCAVYRRPA